MMQLEHWAHRLFPKLNFEDFISRMEKLGGKNEIKVKYFYVRNNA